MGDANDMGESECEQNWVLAAKAGDTLAFDRLIRRYRHPMRMVANGVVGRDLAEDAVQDAALTALRAIHQLSDPDRFGPWLMAIVRNRARRLSTLGSRERALPLHEMDREPAARFDALIHWDRHQDTVATQAVDRLPEPTRQCVALVYLDGWTVGQVAALLELPVTTVKWHLHAGRASLKRWLGPTFEMQP